MSAMRAKMQIQSIHKHQTCEILQFAAVGKSGAYDENGTDEDNTYAKFTPSGSINITIVNPALLGAFEVGEKYYVDFTKAEDPKA